MACVFPGVWLTRATALRLRTALMRLDLPTLERPTIANCGLRSVGKSSALYAARWNSTVRMSTGCLVGKSKSRGAAKRYLRVVWEINDGDCAGILRRRSRDGHDACPQEWNIRAIYAGPPGRRPCFAIVQ